MANNVFLGLGSNLGDRKALLDKALELIAESVGPVIASSGIYETEPWGFKNGTDFLNMVVQVHTELNPAELLTKLALIENKLERKRSNRRYVSRTIDIDILIYGKRVINRPDLIIPHPLIQERKFVLVPLCELAPELVHPVINKTFAELLRECRDERNIKKIDPPFFPPNGGK